MKVLLWMPEGRVPGGHRVQLEKTAEALRALGVEVKVAGDTEPSLEGVDVVHGFGISAKQIRLCRQAGVVVALSTIWWSRAYTAGLTQGLWQPRALWGRAKFGGALLASALRGRHVDKCWEWLEKWHRERVRYEMADVLLPNSAMEAEAIRADLSVTTPMHVVPNAVDESRFSPPVEGTERQGVLYVGRIEPHKNQLGLIRAMRGSDVPVTILGPPHPHHPKYYDQCRRQATGNIRMESAIDHEALPEVYQRHKVHVLPSWFETTGLVSLEAALCGCSIVTTSRGFAREYFEDLAWYCDPGRPRTIREAVEKAHLASGGPGLRERVLASFTWRHTAEATLQAYHRVLTSHHVARYMQEIPDTSRPSIR